MIFDHSSKEVMEIKDSDLVTPQVVTELPPTEDPLADPLRLLQLTGVLHCQAKLTAPWGLDIPRIPHCMAIHIVNTGCLHLELAGQPSRIVQAGSLILLPHGTAHQIKSEPEATATPLTDVPIELVTGRYERMRFGGGGAMTHVSYCGVRYDPVGAHRLLEVLPLVIQMDASRPDDQWLRNTADFIAREADALQPGSEAIITRLTDIVVVQAIRAWLASSTAQHGWLAALNDRQIGRALATIHTNPSTDWTVQRLAEAVGMSRSAFAARFSELVGDSVKHYLTEWRMQLARNDLLTSGQNLAVLSEKYGYQSEAAFSRAFKRVFGEPPNRARKQSAPIAQGPSSVGVRHTSTDHR